MKKKGRGIRVFQTLHGNSRAKLGGTPRELGEPPHDVHRSTFSGIFIYIIHDIYIYIIDRYDYVGTQIFSGMNNVRCRWSFPVYP